MPPAIGYYPAKLYLSPRLFEEPSRRLWGLQRHSRLVETISSLLLSVWWFLLLLQRDHEISNLLPPTQRPSASWRRWPTTPTTSWNKGWGLIPQSGRLQVASSRLADVQCCRTLFRRTTSRSWCTSSTAWLGTMRLCSQAGWVARQHKDTIIDRLLFEILSILLLAWCWCCAGVSQAGHAYETLQKGHAAADVLLGEQLKSNFAAVISHCCLSERIWSNLPLTSDAFIVSFYFFSVCFSSTTLWCTQLQSSQDSSSSTAFFLWLGWRSVRHRHLLLPVKRFNWICLSCLSFVLWSWATVSYITLDITVFVPTEITADDSDKLKICTATVQE